MGRMLKNQVFSGAAYALGVPQGTSSIGPSSPVSGQTRFNTTTNRLEFYANITGTPSWNAVSREGNVVISRDNFTGNGVSTLGTTSGVQIYRGTAPGGNVEIIWNEPVKQWQVSGVTAGSPGDGTKYTNIAVSSTGLTALFDDKAPVLGANLNVNGYTIYANVAATSYINIQGALSLAYANITYTSAIGETVLNAAAEGAGQTGLYVTGVASTNEELVTKRRAFGFSLLLG